MSTAKMRTLGWTIVGLLALGCATPAAAQLDPPQSRVTIKVENDDGGYRVSKKYAAVRDRLVQWRALERLRDFLSFVRLPRTVGALAAECDGGDDASPFYLSDTRSITVCYQFFNIADKAADIIMDAAK